MSSQEQLKVRRKRRKMKGRYHSLRRPGPILLLSLGLGLLAVLLLFASMAAVDTVREAWLTPAEEATNPSLTALERACLAEHQIHGYVAGERFNCDRPCVLCHSERP